MTDSTKKALFIIGSGVLLFLLIKPSSKKITTKTNLKYANSEDDPKNRAKMETPTINPKDIKNNEVAKNGIAALKAYVSAYNNGEPQSVLDELNREFAKEFKVKVYRRKSDSKLVVCDLDGKEIMVNG